MENATSFMEPLFERIEDYGKTSCELIKLKTISTIANATSSFVASGVVVLALAVVIMFLNVGAALWLGNLLGKSFYGFFCIAGFYGLIASILHFGMNKKIKRNIGNAIVSKMLN